MKIYITFGQGHYHNIEGNIFDKDCVAEIEAEDYDSCRAKAFESLGPKFCTDYDEKHLEEIMHHYPRGIIKLN